MLFFARTNCSTGFSLRGLITRRSGIRVVLYTVFVFSWLGSSNRSWAQIAAPAVKPDGVNPHPVQLLLPPVKPLSKAAQLGKLLFFDRTLSASGRQSCASCHSPEHAYNPPNRSIIQPGGPDLNSRGERPPLSLAYLYRQAPFSIGADTELDELGVNLAPARAVVNTKEPPPKKVSIVPQGGLFWDGRADSLPKQALVPLLDSQEMANSSMAEIATKLARASYRQRFAPLFGSDIFNHPDLLVFAAMYAIGRYQIEDVSFHAFTS